VNHAHQASTYFREHASLAMLVATLVSILLYV
jgi:hypothetical protein